MPIFELDGGRPVLVQPMRPAAGAFPTDSTSVVADHLGSLLGEQLFPVATRKQGADAPHLLAVDAAGQPVVVEVVHVLDAEALVRALRYVGGAARLSSADLARAYHGGPERFASELVAFRENVPVAVAHTAARHAGARLLLVCSEVDESVANAVEFLRGPGGHVEVLQVGVLRGADGRRYVDVSPLAPQAPARRAVEPSTLRAVHGSESTSPATPRDAQHDGPDGRDGVDRRDGERRDLTDRREGVERRDGVDRRVVHETRAWSQDLPDVPATRGADPLDRDVALTPQHVDPAASAVDLSGAVDLPAGLGSSPGVPGPDDASPHDASPHDAWSHEGPGLDDALASPPPGEHATVDLGSELRAPTGARRRSAVERLSTGPVPSAGAAAPSGTFPSVLTVPVGPADLGPPEPDPVLADLGAHVRTPTTLVWFRRRRRQRLVATLRPDGLVQLPDGAVFADPGEAAAAAAGIEIDVDGWRVWRLGDDDGPTLAEVCAGAPAAW
ncbi:hypothetical protein [Cellulomonas fimi]|uniref:RAMA domain-containing protein n=1 Tax=Cellulomonas fimi TaxID=1708 RepID=A0A7Y0LZN4_CELFI|nr:hypothetical protein [Cellulomonas fimi]NMR20368.1 hypothetical protein [Cellulomonas fimi]